MFFDGDLQSGIVLALRDSKPVACFVKGDDEQSLLWEHDYLKDDQIILALNARAVTLRISAGSQEAGFLSAYYPVPVVPAFIVIRNGQLLLDLRSGETKDTFKAALLKSLVNTSSPAAPPPTSSSTGNAGQTTLQPTSGQPGSQPMAPVGGASNASTASDQPAMPLRTNVPATSTSAITPNENTSTAPSSSLSNTQSSQTVQNLLADRRRRLEMDKKEKEVAEKAERKAKADARKEAMTSAPDSAKAKQATYAQQQRKRQQEAKLERERILRQIEHDKAERKEKEELRKALAKAEAGGTADGAGGLVDQQLSSEMNGGPRPISARECAIQVRLFDGGTIRSKFPSEQNLRTDVRPWVDEQRSDGDFPYTFKQILTPMPNRTLSISEEEESLLSLGLTPSATLIMVPVQGYTAAYDSSPGVVSRGAVAGYNVVSAGAGLITGALGTFLGLGQAATQGEELPVHENTTQATPNPDARGAASGINIRTLRDQRERQEDHQLYNGNQLNFEPRRDSDDSEDRDASLA